MENAINSLRIRNFKSIKDVTLQPRRVNLIIGQPNVGKSNVLEALSLLGAGLYERRDKFLGDVVRYEQVSNLFYDNDIGRAVMVEENKGSATLQAKDYTEGGYRFVQVSDEFWRTYKEAVKRGETSTFVASSSNENDAFKLMASIRLNDNTTRNVLTHQRVEAAGYVYTEADINESGESFGSSTRFTDNKLLPRKYVFRAGQPHNRIHNFSFLEPPLGHNLWEVVQRHPALRKEVAALFRQYGLKLVMRVGERKFEIQKEEDDLVYTIPYSLIADTLQRIIFYLAAIESNKDSVLLFEEPEAHTFPVYTTMLGKRIVESTSNQFFVATHSPYLLTEIIEGMLPHGQAQDLAIFLAYYEDYQTKFYQLTDAEVLEIRRDAIDVFYNLPRYIPTANPYA